MNNRNFLSERLRRQTKSRKQPNEEGDDMHMRKFCCCFSLEFGAFMMGMIRLIWACVDGFARITGGFTLLFNEYHNKTEAIKSIYLGIYILMAYGISSAILVSGVLKQQADSLQCYKYTARTTTCILFIATLAMFIDSINHKWRIFTSGHVLLCLACLVLEIYNLYIVGSLYDQFKGLKPKEKEKPIYTEEFPMPFDEFV